tara:strand:+ start:214 stop:621 length:408 start_codon:yes stop_codon:yes gene_type:complete
MASLLKVDTLTGVTTAGSISVTGEGNSTTTNLQQGLAKAWACFVQASSHTFHDSLNMSSLTDSGAGFSIVNYTNAFSNDDYASPGLAGKGGARLYLDSVGDAGKSASAMQLFVANTSGTGTDADDVNISCLGDLA